MSKGALVRSKAQSSDILHPLLRAGIVTAALLLALVPLLILLLSSFKQPNEFYLGELWPRIWTGRYYVQNFVQGSAFSNLLNSIIVTIFTTIITVTLGSYAAYALFRMRYVWVPVILFAVLSVMFYPKITTILPYYLTMRSLGLLDTNFAVIIAHVSVALPQVILIMMSFYRQVPPSLEEAAVIDGCTQSQVFHYIMLPLVWPAIASSAILTAVFSWNEFLFAVGVTGRKAATLPVLVSSFSSDRGVDLGGMASISVVIIVPIAIVVLIGQRFLVQGLTAGAVKE